MEAKELELWQEIKDFLVAVNDGDYSTGDAFETLDYFYDKLQKLNL